MSAIATIGFFDGVHRGHRFLFDHLRAIASQRGLQPIIVTFDQHPRALLQPAYIPQLLTTLNERQALLSTFGQVLVLPFAEVQPLTALQFMMRLKNEYQVSVLLMGYDHRFGSDQLTQSGQYQALGEQCGIEVITLDEFTAEQGHVSSTEIRKALEQGQIERANELLGYPYSLTGKVVHGKAIGRTIGFPTANIQPDSPEKIIPRAGVYQVLVNDQPALCNIGETIEVHIPDFAGDLYDQTLTLAFTRFIREERTFPTLQALQSQITEDFKLLKH